MLYRAKFSDERLDKICAYCGEFGDTKDHVPSKILLDKPFPNQLPHVPCCLECNRNFSEHEVYFAGLIECLLCGTSVISKLSNPRVKKALSYSSLIHEKIIKAQREIEGAIFFEPDWESLEIVLCKLAFGHLKFENSETEYEKPEFITFKAISELSALEKEAFFKSDVKNLAPEVGSRAIMSIFLGNNVPFNNWLTVQDGVYKYSVGIYNGGSKVKIILRDYLVCEIIWNK